jgi:hypothetical protein
MYNKNSKELEDSMCVCYAKLKGKISWKLRLCNAYLFKCNSELLAFRTRWREGDGAASGDPGIRTAPYFDLDGVLPFWECMSRNHGSHSLLEQ